jgi:hypothetical protein
MDRTAPAAHAEHDELLIARLYGGDVDDAERARALGLMADCPECESLFADFGAMADATAAIPVPPRPRGFSLTESDAARLRRKAGGRLAVFGPNLRRSLGGSLAALGIVGMVLTSAVSFMGGAAGTAGGYASSGDRAAALPEPGATMAASSPGEQSNTGAVSLATAAPESTSLMGPGNVNPAPSAGVPATNDNAVTPPVASPPAQTGQLAVSSAGNQGAFSGNGTSAQTKNVPGTAGSSGPDARLVWLALFAALFVVGLAVAMLPGRRRGRDRGARA